MKKMLEIGLGVAAGVAMVKIADVIGEKIKNKIINDAVDNAEKILETMKEFEEKNEVIEIIEE